MSNSDMDDFTKEELSVVHTKLSERWLKEIPETHMADVEAKVTNDSDELTECPAVFWMSDGCSFIVLKTGESRYRCQFFYDPGKHFGTGVNEYTDIDHCLTTLLQVQADHESKRSGSFPEQTSTHNSLNN